MTSRNGVAEENLGKALMDLGEPDLALPHFVAAVQYDPQLSTAHYNLGLFEQRQGHRDAALHEYQLALRTTIYPTEAAQAHNNLGFLLLDMDEPRPAMEHFTAALRFDPNKQNSLLGLGIAECRQGSLDEAIAHLSRAARMSPLARADFWLGRAYESKGQSEAAAAAYEAALQLAPGMSEAQERLAALSKQP